MAALDRMTPMTEKGGIPLGQWSGSDATDRLRTVIEENQRVTERQTTTMIRLTWVMAALTVITTVLTVVTAAPIVVQIWQWLRSTG
jgi:hypothetical protein